MATITKNKGNGRNKVMLSDQELKTITIALAILNHQDMEQEMEEQGLSREDVVYDHLSLFKPFAKVSKMYPQKTLEDVEYIVDKINSLDNVNAMPAVNLGEALEKSKSAKPKDNIVYG